MLVDVEVLDDAGIWVRYPVPFLTHSHELNAEPDRNHQAVQDLVSRLNVPYIRMLLQRSLPALHLHQTRANGELEELKMESQPRSPRTPLYTFNCGSRRLSVSVCGAVRSEWPG
jgi:hypothetical protein